MVVNSALICSLAGGWFHVPQVPSWLGLVSDVACTHDSEAVAHTPLPLCQRGVRVAVSL